jgi:hypothetical protein
MIVAHLLDMDGVLVRGGQPIAGSVDYVAALVATGKPFQVCTNNSRFTPEDHAERLRAVGFPVSPEHIYTSALAGMQRQRPEVAQTRHRRTLKFDPIRTLLRVELRVRVWREGGEVSAAECPRR